MDGLAKILSSNFDVGWRDQDYEELLSNVSLDSINTEIVEEFRLLVRYLQLPTKESDGDILVKKFFSGNGLTKLMLSGETANQKICHQMVNSHDLWANALLQNSVTFGVSSYLIKPFSARGHLVSSPLGNSLKPCRKS